MITAITLPVMESILNHALRSDPDALDKIKKLHGKIIQVELIDWPMNFFMVCHESQINLYTTLESKPDTIIKGTFKNFCNIALHGADTPTLFKYPIEIIGDTHVVEELRDTFKNIDLDLEEKLSRFIGDGIAHKVLFHAKKTYKAAKQSRQTLKQNTKEYLHFEAKQLPSKKQIEKFYADVDTLRDDVERAQARINRIVEAQRDAS